MLQCWQDRAYWLDAWPWTRKTCLDELLKPWPLDFDFGKSLLPGNFGKQIEILQPETRSLWDSTKPPGLVCGLAKLQTDMNCISPVCAYPYCSAPSSGGKSPTLSSHCYCFWVWSRVDTIMLVSSPPTMFQSQPFHWLPGLILTPKTVSYKGVSVNALPLGLNVM